MTAVAVQQQHEKLPGSDFGLLTFIYRDEVSYIDAYLEEIDVREKMGEPGIDETTLIASLDNFLLGGLDGIIAAFYSLLYCLARDTIQQSYQT